MSLRVLAYRDAEVDERRDYFRENRRKRNIRSAQVAAPATHDKTKSQFVAGR
jgi:hypothetical protein